MKISAPIVGMHFRPPAKDVLNLLPSGCKLLLVREPDNPHDVNAVKVLLPEFSPDGVHRELYESCRAQCAADEYSQLPWNTDSLIDPLHIGYIDSKKTGKAAEISAQMDPRQMSTVDAILAFDMAGNGVAMVDFSPWPLEKYEGPDEDSDEDPDEQDEFSDEEEDAHERHRKS